MVTKGILYIATGKKYVQAAIKSAKTARKYCPDLHIHLFTDLPNFQEFNFERFPSPFNTVAKMDDAHYRSKVNYMALTPYDQTLYLDTDTAINDDITGMFNILERFDIAMAHAMHRGSGNSLPWRIPLPDAFPELNSGVVLYRSTSKVIQFLKNWGDHFNSDWIEAGIRNKQVGHDQTPLRELLWSSDLRIATLPPEYNVRYLKYHLLWSKSEAQTKIFHLKQLHHGWFYWARKNNFIGKVARRFIPKKWIYK